MKSHYKLIVLGGGTGGITTSSALLKEEKTLRDDVLIIEPNDTHYLQAGFPFVGNGEMTMDDVTEHTEKLIPKGADWFQAYVSHVDPINRVVTAGEMTFEYDFLIVALGFEVYIDHIKGAKESIGRNGVCTNYLPHTVPYTYESLKNLTSGNLIVTKPSSVIKGGVSAENAVFTFRDFVDSRNRNVDVQFYSGREEVFEVPKYNKSIREHFESKSINYYLQQELIEIKADEKRAVFEDLSNGSHTEVPYEMILITPPQGGPSSLKNSGLLNDDGFVDVDPHTMMHKTYTTVFSLGDCTSLPTERMAAGVRIQSPILVKNLLTRMKGLEPTEKYDGKTACPIATEYGGLILAEFGYNRQPKESTYFNQTDDKWIFYQLKKRGIPMMYWYQMMNGRV